MGVQMSQLTQPPPAPTGRRRFRRWLLVAGLGLVVLLVGGLLALVQRGDGPRPQRSVAAPRTSPSAPWRAVDPPTQFTNGGLLPPDVQSSDAEFKAVDDTLLVSDRVSSVTAVDVVTSRVRWRNQPHYSPPNYNYGDFPEGGNVHPTVTAVGGQQAVVFAALVIIPGKGSEADHPAIEVDAVLFTTGAPLWHTELHVDDSLATSRWFDVVVIPADAGILVGIAGDGSQSWLLDPGTRAVRWHNPTVGVLALEGGTAVGMTGGSFDSHQVVGLDPSNGTARWSTLMSVWVGESEARIWDAGPGLVAVTGRNPSLDLLDATTGRALPGLVPAGGLGSCRYDQRSVTVCGGFNPTTSSAGPGVVFAIDPKQRRPLWTLPNPAADRTAVTVYAVWHGAVYVESAHGLIVLDAVTGQDRQLDPRLQGPPYVVDQYFAVVREGMGSLVPGLYAEPAAG